MRITESQSENIKPKRTVKLQRARRPTAEAVFYVGQAALCLCVASPLAFRRAQRRFVRSFLALWCFSVRLSAGAKDTH